MMQLTEIENEIKKNLSIQQEREKAFRLLFHSYKENIYRHLMRMLKDHNDTDEVMQIVFIKIYKGIDHFLWQSKLSTWIYTITSRACISFIKSKKNSKLSLTDFSSPTIHDSAVSLETMDEDRISEIFQKALDQLPHRQKQVFLLRYEEELSYKEISEILQITEGALKATYHIAAEKMEKFIKNQI